MNKQAFEEKIAAIESLRSSPENALEPLRKALRDRNNFICSKAAAVAGDLLLRDAIPDLLEAFDRFLNDPAKTDPQCWAKIAIVKALKDLGHGDPAVFLRGIAHRQTFADAVNTLRGACALALVDCSLPRETILLHLADILADPEMRVRIDGARAIAQLPGQDAILMLRVKAQAGDKEPAVIGQCFLSLLGMDPRGSIPFVARFLTNVDIHPGAVIGERFFIDHGAGVVIGETAEVGEDVTLYQGVTLGGTGFATGKRHPTVQDNVTIGSGAKLLGPITIGHGAKIGANSVVITDVPPNCTVVGNPGHPVRVDGQRVEGPDADWIHLPDPIAEAIQALSARIATLERSVSELSEGEPQPIAEVRPLRTVKGPNPAGG